MERARPLSRLLRRLAIAAALVASPAEARDARVVVVIDVDPRVDSALVVALSPWSLTIVRTPGPRPAPDLDSASSRASAIASEQHAGAVVWISPPRAPDDKASLWVYDAQTLQLAVRPLTEAEPFDDAGAAAVALSVKTVLRASPLATPEPPSEEPPPRPEVPAPAPITAPPPAPHPAWRVETNVGVRTPTGASAAVEPRAALGASVWPATFGDHAGVGLAIEAGPGVSVGTRAFQGELRAASLDVTARLRARGGRWLAFEIQGGPGLLLASLEGQVLPAGVHLHALRLDPSLDLGGIVDVTPTSRVSVGVGVGVTTLLRFQRYALDGAPLLSGPAVTGLGGLRLSVEVD
jgi:hypothetical protein